MTTASPPSHSHKTIENICKNQIYFEPKLGVGWTKDRHKLEMDPPPPPHLSSPTTSSSRTTGLRRVRGSQTALTSFFPKRGKRKKMNPF